MLRHAFTFALIIICSSCDTIRGLSASRIIPAPLDQSCVLETLNADPSVRSAAISDAGTIWGELVIPGTIEIPNHSRSQFRVATRRNRAHELEMVIEMTWIGDSGSTDHRTYVQTALDRLRDRVAARCGHK